MTLENMLDRIIAVGRYPPHANDRRSLLHAYVACLSFNDLCAAIPSLLDEPADVRMALRGRLVRLLDDSPTAHKGDRLVALVEETCLLSDTNTAFRQRVDALHSALIGYLPTSAMRLLLERWVKRGTKSAMARWLKATREIPSLFDASASLDYWRRTHDYRAAKSLAYQAPAEVLRSILDEIVANCEEGWIISKAIVRSGCDDEAIWQLVRTMHPATYLYLCSKLRREISDDDALDLVSACTNSAVEDQRGLAIWALGQMGKVLSLDRIRAATEQPSEECFPSKERST